MSYRLWTPDAWLVIIGVVVAGGLFLGALAVGIQLVRRYGWRGHAARSRAMSTMVAEVLDFTKVTATGWFRVTVRGDAGAGPRVRSAILKVPEQAAAAVEAKGMLPVLFHPATGKWGDLDYASLPGMDAEGGWERFARLTYYERGAAQWEESKPT